MKTTKRRTSPETNKNVEINECSHNEQKANIIAQRRRFQKWDDRD